MQCLGGESIPWRHCTRSNYNIHIPQNQRYLAEMKRNPQNTNNKQTISDLLYSRVTETPDEAAIYRHSGDSWKAVSWKDYHQHIELAARSLLGFGLSNGDKVAIMGRNTLDWFIADMGAITAGLASVPIYESSSSDQILYILNSSSAKVIILENAKYLDRVINIANRATSLQKIIVQNEEISESELIESYKNFCANAKRISREEFEKEKSKSSPSTVATLIYTSGTTGLPKAVSLTHKNTVTAALNVNLMLDNEWNDSERKSCCYLPLSHVAERVVSLFSPLLDGRKVYIVSEMNEVMTAVKEVHPTIWLGVPRIWEKIYEGVMDHAKNLGGFQKKIFQWALKTGLNYNTEAQAGSTPSTLLTLKYGLSKKLVITPLLTSLGLEKVVISITGGAPSRPEITNFFSSLGLWLLEVYGQTECYGTTSLATNSDYKAGSCGKPFPLVDVKIASDGEILVRGDNVSPGYYNDPDSSREVFKNGWLHSGDLGRLDEEGYLWVTGRKKDIIITSGGKNITPSKIENYLCESELINYAVVVGDGKKYLTAILDLNRNKCKVLHSDEGNDPSKEISILIEKHISLVNEKLSRVEQIKKSYLVYDEFTIESGLITNTMKLKRNSVLDYYRDPISHMYEDEK